MIRNFVFNYQDTILIASLSVNYQPDAFYTLHTNTCQWLEDNLVKGVDYVWGTRYDKIGSKVNSNVNESVQLSSQCIFFEKEEDLLAFKLICNM